MQQKFGKYQIAERLGQGGMGSVYASFHPQLARRVAVKVLPDAISGDARVRQRFMREAQTVAILSHPHIINIFDVDEDQGQPYIVMELLEGGSLAARLQKGAIPLNEALDLILPLLDALEYAHRQGVIHRDLKPANVLLRPDGSPVLADFGLARAMQPGPDDDRLTATGTVIGTLAYMAPEQFRGVPTDARTDIYAFGVMFFEMLTGKLPFDGDTAQLLRGHLQDPPPAPRSLNPNIPPPIENLILRMLAKEPDARPQTAAQVAEAIRAFRGGVATGNTIALTSPIGMPTQPLPVAAPTPAAKTSLNSYGWCLIIVLGVIFAAGGAVFMGLLSGAITDGTRTMLPTSTTPEAGTGNPTSELATPAPTQELTALELTYIDEPPMAGAEQAGGAEPFSYAGVTYILSPNSAWFFGEIRNDSNTARSNVQVEITLFDEEDQELVSGTGSVELEYLKPDEVTPFSVLFAGNNPPPEAFDHYTITVLSEEADARELRVSVRDTLRLSDERFAGKPSFGNYPVVQGEVHNDGDKTLQYVKVIVVFYDSDDQVVGVTYTYAKTGRQDSSLEPGASAPFETGITTMSSKLEHVESYMVYVQGSDFS